MRFKRRDKQQQRYQPTISIRMAQTAMHSQASTSTQYPLCLTPRCRPHCSRCNRHLHTYHRHSDTWRSSTADPRPGFTAKHAATAPHDSDVSTIANSANSHHPPRPTSLSGPVASHCQPTYQLLLIIFIGPP